MTMDILPTPWLIEELGPADCVICKKHITGEAYPIEEEWFCEQCAEACLADIQKEAIAFALEHCRITSPLHQFQEEYEYRCGHEEYELGCKESYTENSVRAFNRHCCTNYDDLIEGLDRFDATDHVFYVAIRERIDELVHGYHCSDNTEREKRGEEPERSAGP